MSIIDITTEELLVVRTVKYLSTNPDNKWVNSYEFVSLDNWGVGEALTLANVVVNFEAQLHCDVVTFDHVTVSTWLPDSVPYDPTAFVSVPLSQVGLRSDVPNEVEALGMALRVNRVPVSGRRGNLFYRGCLFENEVYAPAGIPILSVPGDIQTLVDDAITDSGLDAYLSDTSIQFVMVMVDATGSVVRIVNSLLASGVSLIKQDHQWFNRTSP